MYCKKRPLSIESINNQFAIQLYMKNFNSYSDFAFFTIRENLRIADSCINTPKKKGTKSCYGMPALILLSSIIDTIGTFYRSGTFSNITQNEVSQNNLGHAGDHFEHFYDKFIENNTNPQWLCNRNLFIGDFYKLGRCRATHNSVLGPKIRITINDNKNGAFIWEKHNIVHIQLKELNKLVKNAFSTMITESNATIPIVDFEEFTQTTGGTIN